MEQCIAIYDFEAEEEDELSFKKGNLVTVMAKGTDSGWWKGTYGGRTGVFPNCLVSFNLERDAKPRFTNKARALYDYENPDDKDEMRFSMGDVITIHKPSDKSPGWWWGTNETGPADQRKQMKMFPSNFFTCNLVRALYNFAARSPHELSFRKDDIVTVIRRWNDSWWEGRLGKREGIFPANYTTANMCTLSPPMFSNASKEVLKVGATECHVCAANEEIVNTMMTALDEWHEGGRTSRLNLFEYIDIEPTGRPGTLLTPEDMKRSARQRFDSFVGEDEIARLVAAAANDQAGERDAASTWSAAVGASQPRRMEP
eukprot:TRINITY_DN47887_c0_g1_i1.p1 TRINITY_DN47887_c0_g1~~TRINITY_DN47887_c0_g1_i1.p1  ORF type:complete len:315 (+),score=99.05 TRINITY_DN47887_c0_g1_i1:95-1039(+)